MLIGLLVELHVRLHSCLCFSHLEKLVLKAGSTPPRYLIDTLLSVELLQLFLIAILIASRHLVDRSRMFLHPRQHLDTWWINREFFCLLDSFSTPGGSIEILIWYLMICSSTSHRYLLLSMTIFLDTFLDRCLDTFICRDLLLVYISFLVRSDLHFSRSLSRYFSVFSPKLSHLTQIFVPQGFFKLFQDFLHLVSFLSLILHAYFMF